MRPRLSPWLLVAVLATCSPAANHRRSQLSHSWSDVTPATGTEPVELRYAFVADATVVEIECRPRSGSIEFSVLAPDGRAVWWTQVADVRLDEALSFPGRPGIWRVTVQLDDFSGSWAVTMSARADR